MPSLAWPNKGSAEVEAAYLTTDSVIYPGGRGYPQQAPRDRLILGENLAVMTSLLPEYEGKVDLIYADPPFYTNRTFRARVGRGEDSRRPKTWQLGPGYQDAWPRIDDYLDFLYPRLQIMHRLLSRSGTLYLHLDWHAGAHARILLDEIFGSKNLLNEIVWVYHGPSPIRSAFNRKHDTLLVYVKGTPYTFNADQVRVPYNPSTVSTFRSSPKAGFGKVPDLKRGKVPEDWWYFPVVARLHGERTGYPTQKPEALLERVILASSNPGDLVADFFCGAGTCPVVAARNGRRFLACDQTWRAVHHTRGRLLAATRAPFTLETSAPAQRPARPSQAEKLGLRRTKAGVHLEGLSTVDYWEVDPAFDGRLFRSADQSQRPWRQGEVAPDLKARSARKARVRIVTVKGRQLALDV